MKICILGLDCAAPEVIFGDERLVNIRRLMDTGVYGGLESVNIPITVRGWMGISMRQDPGSLRVYGCCDGFDRIHHGFANYFYPKHRQFKPDNPYQNAIPEYYLRLDEEIDHVLEQHYNDTIVLLVSDHGAQTLDAGVAINEWLTREGLLLL